MYTQDQTQYLGSRNIEEELSQSREARVFPVRLMRALGVSSSPETLLTDAYAMMVPLGGSLPASWLGQ